MPRKPIPGPFIIVDADGQPLQDAKGSTREFSTIARATPHLRAGDKVELGQR